MLVYGVALILILLLGLSFYSSENYLRDREKVKKKYIITICFILVLVSGLRNVAVGDDTYGYFLNFEDAKSISWQQAFVDFKDYYLNGVGKDPGYPIFVKLIQVISEDFTIYLLITALIFYSALGSFIHKNTNKLSESVIAFTLFFVLFFYVFSVSAIRQSLAIAATMLCYEFVKNKKLIRFLVLILVASTIHKSVLIFIPFYFLCQYKVAKHIFTAVLLLFPLFMSQRQLLAQYFISIGGYDEYENFEGSGTLVFTSIFIVISVVGLLRRKIILSKSYLSQNYYNAFALALLLLPLSWINPSLLRITMYFSIFMILFIPEIVNSFDNFSLKFRRGIGMVTLLLLFVLYFQSNWNKEYMVYKFYWQEMKLGKNYE